MPMPSENTPTGPVRALIVVLAALTAVAPLATDIYVPAFPELADSLPASDSAVQLSLTAFLVGLAGGQLLLGPLSDGTGRRRVLLVGTAAFVVCSLGCAVAPTVTVLNVARFLQGVAGAAGIVVARAVITDRFHGAAAARHFAALSGIVFLAPVLAPALGGALLGVGSWRLVFVALAGFGVLQLAGVLAWVPESLPVERRRPGGLRTLATTLGGLLARRELVGYLAVAGFAFAAFFAYITGATFAFQDGYGLTDTQYSLVFLVNALCLLVAGTGFGRLAARVDVRRLLGTGLAIALTAAVALAVVELVGAGGFAVTWCCLGVLMIGYGIGIPATVTLTQGLGADAPGAVSGLLGCVQFVFGAAGAPLTGLLGGGARAMALVVAAGLALAFLALAGARNATESGHRRPDDRRRGVHPGSTADPGGSSGGGMP